MGSMFNSLRHLGMIATSLSWRRFFFEGGTYANRKLYQNPRRD